MKYSIIPLVLIISIIGCTHVPLKYLRGAPEGPGNRSIIGMEENGVQDVFKLTYWNDVYKTGVKTYKVLSSDFDTSENIESNYLLLRTSNKRLITIQCIDTNDLAHYRIKVISVDVQNEENLIIDQEMHNNSEVSLSPQAGKKYFISIYNISINSESPTLMKQFTYNMMYLKVGFYAGPTLYPLGSNYGKYALGWGNGIAITPWVTGTCNNNLFAPNFILFHNIYMLDSISNSSQNISNLENIGIGSSWLYGISGGIIIDLRNLKKSQGFFGLDIAKVIGFLLQ